MFIRKLILIVFLFSLCGCTRDNQRKLEDIKQSLRDIYTAKSIEQFNKSREKYIDYLYTEEVANQLYVSRVDTLENTDKSVSMDIVGANISKANKNSEGLLQIVVLAKFYADNVESLVEFKFLLDDGKVVSYTSRYLGGAPD